MFDWKALKIWLDVAVILLPVIVTLFLVYKLILPRKPKLGLGIMAGVGLIGAFLIRRKLKNAFAVENKLAKFDEEYAAFKEKQKRRQQAVTTNQEVIKILEKRKQRLAKNAHKYETELQLIDAELKDRKELNKRLLSESMLFVKQARERSAKRKALLGMENSETKSNIEIDGYHLLEE